MKQNSSAATPCGAAKISRHDRRGPQKNEMKTNTLILAGDGYSLTIAPEAETVKAELIKHAALIVEVRDPSGADAARNQIKELAAMRNTVEKSRKTVKEPVLQVGKDIDQKAKDFVAEIEEQEKRLSRLMGDYAALVERERQRVLREMEEKRQAEEKARREAEEARLKAEREAEAARIAAEKAMWQEVDDRSAEEQAAAEYQRAKAEAEAARQKEAEEAAARAATVVAMVPTKTEGVKFVHDFEVLEIQHLAFQRPALVKMEPKRAEILSFIKERIAEGIGDDDPSWAEIGLKITRKPVVSTR